MAPAVQANSALAGGIAVLGATISALLQPIPPPRDYGIAAAAVAEPA